MKGEKEKCRERKNEPAEENLFKKDFGALLVAAVMVFVYVQRYFADEQEQ